VPAGGNVLEGSERSRMLKNLKLRFGDMGATKAVMVGYLETENIGHLAVTSSHIVSEAS